MAVVPRCRNAVALIGALALIAMPVGIVYTIRTSANPVDSANVWSAYLAAVPVLLCLISWWWKGRRATAVVANAGQVMAAADQLALGMLETWRLEARERRISTPAPD
jgi:hypothetical protein